MSLRYRIVLLLLSVGTIAAGCSTNPTTGKRHIIIISQQQEIAMGSEAAPEFEKEFGGKVPNQQLQDYVRSVGMKLAGVSDRARPYEYTLVSSDVPNAFALPGGKIFITAGLMSRMENERELAAVLAHETAHVAAQHNVLGMQRQMGASVLAELAGMVIGGDKGKAAQAAAQIVTGVASLKYSRDDEYEADKYGIKYMQRAGYNPYGMVELLTTLKNLSESEGGTLTEMFQTHPLTQKRIDQARGVITAEYPKYSPDKRDPRAAVFRRNKTLLLSEMAKAK